MNNFPYRGIVVVIFSMILFVFSFGQQIKNYREEFTGISRNATSEVERLNLQKRYFNSLNKAELLTALSDIAKLGDANFIAYSVLPLIKEKFDSSEFRRQLLSELVKENNTTEYKLVLIDYLDKKKFNFPEQMNLMSDTYFAIANNKNLPNRLRQIAASKVGMTSNHVQNKSRVMEMIRSNDIPLINGAAKTIKSFVRSESLKNERDEWTEELITALKNNNSQIKELGVLVNVLGYTGSSAARTYLLSLFDEYKNIDIKFTETIVYSLSNNADTNAINKIISEYRQNKKYDNFGSELTMKTIANNNVAIVEQLGKLQTTEAKINYLRLIKYINEPADKEQLINTCRIMLDDVSEEVRLESIMTLCFLLASEDEEKIFREHLTKERSQIVKNKIYSYIGR